MNGFMGIILRYRAVVLGLILIGTAFFGYFMLRVKLNADFSTYLSQSDPTVVQFNLIGEEYAAKSLLLAVIESDDVFTAETLALVRDLTAGFEQVEGVVYVTSLANVLDFRKTDGGLEIARLFPGDKIPATDKELGRLRDYVLSNDMYVRNLVSADGGSTLIVVRIDAAADEIAVTRAIQQVAGGIAPDPERISFGGLPYMMDNMAFIIYRMVDWLIPVMLLLMVAILWVGFRRLGGVVVPLLVVGVSAVWAVGAMGLVGIDLNMLTGVMPVVLVALGSADGIHVMRRYYEKRQAGLPLEASIRETFSELAVPITVTTVTTMVGFLSLAISDFRIIREFGIATTIGVFIALAVTLLVVPVLLSCAGKKSGAEAGGGGRIVSPTMEWLAEWVFHRRGVVLALTGVLAFAALAVIPLIERDVDWALCLPRGSKGERAEMFLRREYGGTLPIQVLVKGNLGDPIALQALRDLERYLDSLPEINDPQSVASLLSEMNWVVNDRYLAPETGEGVSNLWFLIENEPVVEQLAKPSRQEGLVQARIGTWSTGVFTRTVDEVQAFVANLPRKLAAIDPSRLTPDQRRRVLALRRERVIENLRRTFAKNKISVPREAILQAFQGLAAGEGLTGELRENVRGKIASYLRSDQVEVGALSQSRIAGLSAAVSQALKGEGQIDAQALLPIVEKNVANADAEDLRALADSLAWVASQSAGAARVDRLMATLRPLMPRGGEGLRGLEKDLKGDLWRLNQRLVVIARAETERLRIDGDAAPFGQAEISYQVTGLATVMKKMEEVLLPTQIWSMLLALAGVAVLLTLMFHSVTAGLIGIVPIALTILINFAAMAALGIGLDFITAMIASVAIGLGIDYAVHTLSCYRRELLALGDELEALKKTFATTGVAIIINTLAVGAGFAVLLLAPGQHMQRFGGLVALTMFFAALFTLTVLPVLALWLKPAFLRRA